MESPEGPKKIRSVRDLQAIKDRVNHDLALREDGFKSCITVHMGTCGIASGAREVLDAIVEELEIAGRTDVRVTTSGCVGVCSHEPAMTVERLGESAMLYGDLTPAVVRDIFRRHVLGGLPVEAHALRIEREGNMK